MLYDALPVLLIFVAVVIIVAVILRRLPDIATINVETIPEAQSAAAKRQLLVQRLERKFRALAKQTWEGSASRREAIRSLVGDMYGRLLEWEKKNKKPSKVLSSPGAVESVLAEAEQAREAERDEAEELYLEVIRLDHRNAKAYLGLGLLYRSYELYEEARQALEYAVRIDRANVEAFAALGKLSEEEGKYVDARAAYEQAIALDPENIEFHIALGDIALLSKDAEGALSAFESAAALEPSNPRCLDRLLEACILVGNKRLATSTLKRLSEVNPENNKLVDFRTRVAALPSRPPRK